MARLMIVVLFAAVVAGMAIGTMSSLGRAARAGQRQLAQARLGDTTMQRLSGILLLALILYVSVWGGA